MGRGKCLRIQDSPQTIKETERPEVEGAFIYSVSPNGKYYVKTEGEKSLGGLVYPESVQIRKMEDDKVFWSDTSHIDSGFLWSEDSRYLAIQSSGDTWTECRLLDCNSWEELPAPDIQSLCELAEAFPAASENGIAEIIPLRWLSENTLLLEVFWDAEGSLAQRTRELSSIGLIFKYMGI